MILALFISPGFAMAGAALVAVPILIHILNRRRFKVVPWAAMEYLLAAMNRNRKRLRFEQWLLLTVRCLVVGLLGLALARPTGCGGYGAAGKLGAMPAGLHVFVIDNSYSMAYETERGQSKTHLEQAKLLAKARIDQLVAGGESVAVITAGMPAAALIGEPTYDLDAARSAVERINQSASGTDIAGALERAVTLAQKQTRQSARYLYLYTDGTRSAWADSTRVERIKQLGQEAAKLYRVHHALLGLANQANAAVLDLRPTTGLLTTRFPADFQALARGFGTLPPGNLQWRLDGQELGTVALAGLSADSPPLMRVGVQMAVGGPHVLSAVMTPEDRLKMDNVRWRVVDVASGLRVLVVEGDRGVGVMAGSAAFLSTALAPESGEGSVRSGSYVVPETISDLELGNRILGDYRAVILTNVAQVSAAQADQLVKFVKQGGTLMWFMGEQISRESYNSVLLPRRLMPGSLVKVMRKEGTEGTGGTEGKEGGE